LLHYDSLNKKLRSRKGSRISAITKCGAIPEVFDYRVLLEPEGHFIGTLNEDFAIESLPGDVFPARQYLVAHLRIGNAWFASPTRRASRRRCRSGWRGAGPKRRNERCGVAPARRGDAGDALTRDYQLPQSAAEQIVDYLDQGKRALGVVRR
jgi:ATP-dependent Lhr-like helicase